MLQELASLAKTQLYNLWCNLSSAVATKRVAMGTGANWWASDSWRCDSYTLLLWPRLCSSGPLSCWEREQLRLDCIHRTIPSSHVRKHTNEMCTCKTIQAANTHPAANTHSLDHSQWYETRIDRSLSGHFMWTCKSITHTGPSPSVSTEKTTHRCISRLDFGVMQQADQMCYSLSPPSVSQLSHKGPGLQVSLENRNRDWCGFITACMCVWRAMSAFLWQWVLPCLLYCKDGGFKLLPSLAPE